MDTLLTNIGTILASLLTWLGQVAGYLITNPIFMILLAVIFFTLVFNLIKSMVDRKKTAERREDLFEFMTGVYSKPREDNYYYKLGR